MHATPHLRRSVPQCFMAVVAIVLLFTASLVVPSGSHAQSTAQRSPQPTGSERVKASTSAYATQVLTTRDGLPQNIVWSVEQGEDGSLWIGTFGGLARFDGHSFQHFDAVQTPGLTRNRITALHQQPGGPLWIGGETGLSVYDQGRFRSVEGPVRVKSIREDRDGTVWIRARSPRGPALYRSAPAASEVQLISDTLSIGAIAPAGGDSTWMVSGGRLLLWNGAEIVTPIAPPAEVDEVRYADVGPEGTLWVVTGIELVGVRDGTVQRYGLRDARVHAMAYASDGTPWLATASGLLRLTSDGVRPVDGGGVLSGVVRGLSRDESGQWWVGTQGQGLVRLRPRLFQSFEVGAPVPRAVRSVLAGDDGRVWAALEKGGLLEISPDRSGGWTHHDTDSDARAWALAATGDDLLVGTTRGLMRRRSGRLERVPGVGRTRITALHRDTSGTVWIGTRGQSADAKRGGVFQMTGDEVTQVVPPEALGSRILALHRDRRGGLWIGTRSHGVARLSNGTLRWYTRDDGLPYISVRDVYESADGTVWVATYGGGIARFNGDASAGPAFSAVTPEEGLPSGFINAIQEAPTGVFWLTSTKGVFRASGSQLQAVADDRAERVYPLVFDETDGMPHAECNGPFEPSMAQDAAGHLWIPTMKGLAGVDPYSDRFSLPKRLPVEVRSVRADGEAMMLDSLRLPASTYRVAIDYTATSLRHGDDLVFRYRIDEGAWRTGVDVRTAEYTELGAGTHRFEVQATLNGHKWYALDAPLAFTIAPHFYQTWWFQLLLGVALLGLGVGAYRWRTHRLRTRKRQLKALIESRTATLQARTEALENEKDKTEAQAERLERLDQAKSRFLTYLSHEIRTPLTLILGPISDALDAQYGSVPEKLRERLRTAKTQALRVRTLVNQLLDLSKLKDDKMEIAVEPIELRTFLDRMTDLFSRETDRKNLRIRIETDAEQVCADPEALTQILTNLLSNAVKHAPEGSEIVVRARSASQTASNDPADASGAPMTALSVEDAGPGLPEAFEEDVFAPYVQAGNTEENVGTGIGLAVTREYARRHGGDVEAQTRPEGGTTMTVYLPCDCHAFAEADRAEADRAEADRADPDRADPDRADPTSDRPKGKQTESDETEGMPEAPERRSAPSRLSEKAPLVSSNGSGDGGEADGQRANGEASPPDDRAEILVVDDDASVRRYLAEVLSPAYAVRAASDGEEALASVQQRRPALVVSDVEMPGMDGFELCRSMREDTSLRGIPMVLLTVRSESESRLKGLKKGADAYVSKPFDPETLRQRVENLIDVRRFLRQQPASAADASPGPAQRDDGTQPGDDARGGTGGTDVADGTDESEFLQEVRSIVEAHLDNSNFGVAWLADEVGLSRRQLQRKVQAETDLTTAAFIRALRLKHAARLLEEGTASTVKDAANAVGYRDPTHFSQIFEDALDRSPADLIAENAS